MLTDTGMFCEAKVKNYTSTSLQGSLGMGVMRNGYRLYGMGIAVLHVCVHHFVRPWIPLSGALFRLSDALVAFIREGDHLLPQSAGNYYSCTSDY